MQSANGASWNGLVAMCPLVRAAHLPPWLRVLARRRSGIARTKPRAKASL